MAGIRIKRVYEAADKADGFRILVDRLWPRGVSREKAAVDLWLKEVGPSDDLRKWFGHDPERYEEFARRYRTELEGSDAFSGLRRTVREQGTVTLVYSARDEEHNQARVLKELLETG